MCLMRKPLPQGWAWLKLCSDCATAHLRGDPNSASSQLSAESGGSTSSISTSAPKQ
jgi:hypothetical protein